MCAIASSPVPVQINARTVWLFLRLRNRVNQPRSLIGLDTGFARTRGTRGTGVHAVSHGHCAFAILVLLHCASLVRAEQPAWLPWPGRENLKAIKAQSSTRRQKSESASPTGARL
jgi:hypothetical protein